MVPSKNRFWIAFPGQSVEILLALRRHSAATGETMAALTRRALREFLSSEGAMNPDALELGMDSIDELYAQIVSLPDTAANKQVMLAALQELKEQVS